MDKLQISIRTFSDIQNFVALATIQPFEITVGNDYQQVSAKSFMGMISLDYSKPVFVHPVCSDLEYDHFRQAASDFLTEL